MTSRTIRVSGVVAGRLWWPVGAPASCVVAAEIVPSDDDTFPASGPYPDLRTALVEMLCTAARDLSSTGFLPGSLVIQVRRTTPNGAVRTRDWIVRGGCWETEDLFASEPLADELELAEGSAPDQ
jgi:hypothetical protein